MFKRETDCTLSDTGHSGPSAVPRKFQCRFRLEWAGKVLSWSTINFLISSVKYLNYPLYRHTVGVGLLNRCPLKSPFGIVLSLQKYNINPSNHVDIWHVPPQQTSLEIIDIIGKDLDNGKLPIGVFLDSSKAFDTLEHTILLDKLIYYGIKGTELAWFNSYLINRTQFVSYNGTNSHTLSITTGVPQGSILGPLLFIIYMNDIHNASSKFHAILFADDTNLTSTLCSFDVDIDNNCNSLQLSTNINKELKSIQIWT